MPVRRDTQRNDRLGPVTSPDRPGSRAVSMIARLVTVLLALLSTALAPAQSARNSPSVGERLLRWHAAWQSGRIGMGFEEIEPARARQLYGAATVESRPQVLSSHRAGLAALLEEAMADESEESIRALLVLAAVGLGDGPTLTDKQGDFVRELAHQALGGATSAATLDLLMRTARGDRRDWKPWADANRLAAIRALGLVSNAVARIEIARQLSDSDRLVRVSAADALGARASAHAVSALNDALAGEADTVAALAMLDALHSIVTSDGETLGTREARRALAVALDCLGRFDWRCDAVVVEICALVRSPMSIEPLIGVLERCLGGRGHSDRVRSGTLRERAHAVLRELTGTLLPIDRPDQWHEFWGRVRGEFRMPPRPRAKAEENRTTSGFFGIPVTGTRVLFVIDTSGSMDAEMMVTPTVEGTTSRDPDAQRTTRLDQAKAELVGAVAALSPDAHFGVISFSDDIHRWGRPLVSASDGGRGALRTLLSRLYANGSTNLFGALDEALDIEGTRWGQDVEANIDELFVLSDGQPSSGKLVDSEAILAAVRRVNSVRRVRIHTVILGGATDFVRRLATDNGGRCVER